MRESDTDNDKEEEDWTVVRKCHGGVAVGVSDTRHTTQATQATPATEEA
jgi:hypothetical protein